MTELIEIESVRLCIQKKENEIQSISILSNEPSLLVDGINAELNTLFTMKEMCLFQLQHQRQHSYEHSLELTKNQYEKELCMLREELQTKTEILEKNKQLYEDERQLLQLKFSQSISNLNSSIEMRVQQESRHIEEKFKMKEEFYKQTIQELKNTNLTLDTIRQDNSTIMHILQKSKTSAEIGIEGEQSIYRILRSFTQYNVHAKVENVSSTSMSGDIRFVYDKMKCCIEVKNIKDVIGQSHFDKFHRDVHKSFNQYNCGIFISIQSGFSIKSQIQDMEIRIYNNKPIIYLARTEQNQDKIIIAIHMMNRLVQLIDSGYTLETYQFVEQFKIQVEQWTAVQTQLKNMKQSIKIIEDIASHSKKNIYEIFAKEELPSLDKIDPVCMETPCGKTYKGVTKNYKNHLQTCVICKEYMDQSIT